jgi:hypothetical protein
LKFEVLGGFDSYNFDYSRDFAFVQIGAETPSNLHRSRSVSDCKGFCGAHLAAKTSGSMPSAVGLISNTIQCWWISAMNR